MQNETKRKTRYDTDTHIQERERERDEPTVGTFAREDKKKRQVNVRLYSYHYIIYVV